MRSWKKVLASAALIASVALLGGCERTDPTAPAQSTIDLSANPSTIDLTTHASGTSLITAFVLDKDGNPLTGVKVYFTTNSGTLRSGGDGVSVNGSGLARDTLTLRQGDDPATVTARATGAGSDTVTVSTNEPGAPTITLAANPSTIDLSTDSDGTSVIVATVRRDTGQPFQGAQVVFSTTSGTLSSGTSPVTADANGQARDTLKLTRTQSNATVTGSVQGYSVQGTVQVAILKPAASLEVFANPGAVNLIDGDERDLGVITASVRQVWDNSAGIRRFRHVLDHERGGGSLSTTAPVVTDSSGQAEEHPDLDQVRRELDRQGGGRRDSDAGLRDGRDGQAREVGARRAPGA